MCNGRKFIFTVNEDGYEIATKCQCLLNEIQTNRIKFANMPESFKNVSIKDIQIDCYNDIHSRNTMISAFKAINYYLQQFEKMEQNGTGLYLFSSTKGSGKTLTIAAIANKLLEKHQVKFAGSTVILQEIKNTYGNRQDKEGYTENKLLDALVTTEILVIDDFGTERVTDWVNDKFYHIINERYLNKKVTLFTSNESIRTLNYDERITNRIMEMCYEIPFPEESVREHIADKKKSDLVKIINGV